MYAVRKGPQGRQRRRDWARGEFAVGRPESRHQGGELSEAQPVEESSELTEQLGNRVSHPGKGVSGPMAIQQVAPVIPRKAVRTLIVVFLVVPNSSAHSFPRRHPGQHRAQSGAHGNGA